MKIGSEVITKYGKGVVRKIEHDTKFDKDVYHVQFLTGKRIDIDRFYDYEIQEVKV